MSTLMRQEVELAKAELKQTASRAGKGSGMLAGAGVAGHFVLLFLSLALWWGLGTLMGLGWSGVVVADHLGHHRRRPGLDGPQGTQGDQGHAADRRDPAGNPPDPQTQPLSEENTMSENPDAIRADIEATRARLGTNVDAVADKVTPSHIVQRQTDK